ncbi:MAG: class I SAM-dependent methyltransferase [Aquabacterium sp.]|uniref:class I SAM-dependent methyltransferase n=1 Tax=Aquabacterium sp. TaxID=1872578 RepID=UPI003BC04693
MSFYNENAVSYALETAQADLSQLYSQFAARLQPGARVLDLGCGGGRDLRAFKTRGFDCIGVDPSARLAKISAETSGCEVLVSKAQELSFVDAFDGIWACASLLHLPKVEMPATLTRLRNALRSNGVLFLSMQEGHGSSVEEDGRFYARYSNQELRELVVASGLNLIDQWITADSLKGRESIAWINLLAVKPSS